MAKCLLAKSNYFIFQSVTGSTDKFKSVLQREATFLQDKDRKVYKTPQSLSGMELDPVADKILQHCHFQHDQKAIKSTGDGDCLFNSVSTLLVGDESLATELRFKTCLEMFLNKENIQQHKDRASFSCLSPTYDTALKECARPRQYSCVWTILALSNIINVPMEILYPCVNGTQDLAFQKFNLKTSPEDPISDTAIKIMWTSTMPPKPNKQWTPNHFVPVVPSKSTSSVPNNDRREFNFSFKISRGNKSTPKSARSPSPPRKQTKQSKVTTTTRHVRTSPPSSPYSLPSPTFDQRVFVDVSPSPPRQKTKESKLPKTTRHVPTSPPSSPHSLPSTTVTPQSSPSTKTPVQKKRSRDSPSPYKQRKRSRLPSSPISSPPCSFHSSINLSNRYSILEEEEGDCAPNPDTEIEEPNTVQSLPHNRFMTVDSAYKAVTACDEATVPQNIPIGQKSNAFILIKANKDKKFEFPDDCGAWGRSGTTVNSTYAYKDNKLKTVVIKQGSYCVEKKIQGQRTFVPLEPQPHEDTIVKCHRYYARLKIDPEYQKRVTVFTRLPTPFHSKENIALVEYQGIFKNQKTPHGNNTRTNEAYYRTDPQILRTAAAITKTQHQMPIKTSNQMMMDDSLNAPNAKQITDKVYRESKKDQNNLKLTNIADEVLATLTMCQNGENNIREVITTPNKPPSVIVYSNEQLEDLKTNCVGPKGSVIGIDRTFNLGPCFVTTTTYKNRKIIKRDTLQNPIFLGPTLLHWDGETDSYYKFLTHLTSKLGFDVLIIRLACLHVYRGRTVFRTPLEISLYFYGFNLKRVNSIQRVHCIALLTFKQRTGTHNSMTLCAFPCVLKQQNVNGAKGGGV